MGFLAFRRDLSVIEIGEWCSLLSSLEIVRLMAATTDTRRWLLDLSESYSRSLCANAMMLSKFQAAKLGSEGLLKVKVLAWLVSRAKVSSC